MSSLEPRLKVSTCFFHKNRLVSEFMSQKEITSLIKKNYSRKSAQSAENKQRCQIT